MDPAIMRQAVMKALHSWPEPGGASHGSRTALPPGTNKYSSSRAAPTREEMSAAEAADLTNSSRESSRSLFGNQQAPSLSMKAPPHEGHRNANMERRSPGSRSSEPNRVIPRRFGVGSETTVGGHSAPPASWQPPPPAARAGDPTPSRDQQLSGTLNNEPRVPEQAAAGSVADFKGVMLSSDKKSFVSFVACMGEVHFVGHFGSALEAAIAHDNAVLRLLGPEAAAFTNYYERRQPSSLAVPAAAVERRDSNSEEQQQNKAKERFLEDLFASRSANFSSFRPQLPRSLTVSDGANRDSQTSELQAMHASAFEQALLLHSARSSASAGRQSKTAAGRDPSDGQPPIGPPAAFPFGQREAFEGALGKQMRRQYRSSSTNGFPPAGSAEAPTDRQTTREADSKKRSREPTTTKASPSGDQTKPAPKKRGRPKLEDSQNGGVKSSRFRGVSWNKKDDKWQAMIFAKGKARWIGYFKKEEDAARAYDKEALAERGPRALLNFPPQAEYAVPEATSN